MRMLPCGESALLVELGDMDAVIGMHRALAAQLPAGVTELVPAARTLLVRFDPARTAAGMLARTLAATTPDPGCALTGTGTGAGDGDGGCGDGDLDVPTVYDGEDLPEVARQSGLTEEEVIALHSRALYTVAFCGFAPGFGYCIGLDPRLRLPRRATPRTRVPAGAVAIAGEFTAVYPQVSPGGWQLIGRTDVRIWDLDREPPALMRPGVRVRFTERS